MSNRKFTIRSALRDHLLEMDDLPEIKWELQVFNPPADSPYIRETMLPADEFVSANNERTNIGIYQLDLIVPMGYSVSEAENLADDIKQHFRPAQTIGQVVLERAAVGQADDSNKPWIVIPIQIDYRTFQLNVHTFDSTFDSTFA